MRRSLVIVPTFSRPEMLWNALDHLAACPESAEMEFRIAVDSHVGNLPPIEEINEVIKHFAHLNIVMSLRTPHSYHGNSYNLLTAYKEALLSKSEYVFMVEDDVMVAPDFFEWHFMVQELRDLFCSVAVRNSRSGKLISRDDYASLGVCFKRKSIERIASHAKHDYYKNLRGYCVKTFGKIFQNEDYEQDGLILRVMGTVSGESCWPVEPKAKHIGWYSYHRPGPRPQGTLRERYEIVRARCEQES